MLDRLNSLVSEYRTHRSDFIQLLNEVYQTDGWISRKIHSSGHSTFKSILKSSIFLFKPDFAIGLSCPYIGRTQRLFQLLTILSILYMNSSDILARIMCDADGFCWNSILSSQTMFNFSPFFPSKVKMKQ